MSDIGRTFESQKRSCFWSLESSGFGPGGNNYRARKHVVPLPPPPPTRPPSARNNRSIWALFAGAATEVRRAAEPGAGQHTAGGRADGHVHLQHVHDHQRPLHRPEQHGAGAVHRVRVAGADVLPDGVHTGRVPALVRHARPDTQEARPRDRHVPVGQQPGHVGHQHAGEVAGRLAPDAAQLLRAVGVDHHHARVHAAGHILPVPLHRVPVRDMEALVQDQAHVRHVTHCRSVRSWRPLSATGTTGSFSFLIFFFFFHESFILITN